MAKLDKTESNIKMIGFIGAGLSGLAMMAGAVWSGLKTGDALKENRKAEKAAAQVSQDESSKTDS